MNENSYQKMQQRHIDAVNRFPMFFACNKEQFAEGMKKLGLAPGETAKVCNIKGSPLGFTRKVDLPKWIMLRMEQARELKAAIAADSTGEGFIRDMFSYELANHEYSYTQDLSETLCALGMTPEEINKSPALRHGLWLAVQEQNCYC